MVDYVAGDAFGAPRTQENLPLDSAGTQDYPVIADMTGGGFVTAWISDNDLYVQRYDAAGEKLGYEWLVAESARQPSITGLNNGGFAVAWVASDGSLDGVFAQTFDSEGLQASYPFEVAIATYASQQQPSIAAVNDFIVVAWTDDSSGMSNIKTRTFSQEGRLGGPEFRITADAHVASYHPIVAAQSDHQFVVSWTGPDAASGTAANARVYNLVGNAQSATFSSHDVGGVIGFHDGYYQSVAVLASGDMVMTWTDSTASGTVIKGQLYTDAGVLIGGQFQVSVPGVEAGQSVVSALGGGGFVVAWRPDAGGEGPNYFQRGEIQARVYGADGVAAGDAFQVNDVTALGQDLPALTGFGTNDFALVWRTWAGSGDTDVALHLYYNNIRGTPGADTKSGTAGVDLIDGLGGNDTLTGLDGPDLLRGGDGNDVIRGGNGIDTLLGGEGNDTIIDSNGDTVDGGGGGDNVVWRNNQLTQGPQGGTGIDTITIELAVLEGFSAANGFELLGEGVSQIWGTGGANRFDFGGFGLASYYGGVVILGNSGDDVMIGSPGDDGLDGGEGDDTLEGRDGDDRLHAGNGNDLLLGGNDDDWLFGRTGAGTGVSQLYGGEGDDHIFSYVAGDTIDAGGGNDQVILQNEGLRQILQGGAGIDHLQGNSATLDTFSAANGFEILDVGSIFVGTVAANLLDFSTLTIEYTSYVYAVDLSGLGGDDLLTGTLGRDRLHGGEANDRLDGGRGADEMDGGVGDDLYLVDNAGDVVTELAGEGLDTVRTTIGYVLGADVENLELAGTGNIGGTGNALANRITGNAGANALDGGAGADDLRGGAGNDRYVVDVANDLVTELAGEGVDTVAAWLSYALGQNVENLALLGTANLDGTGNALVNVLVGNSGMNRLNGGKGADRMEGGAGDDSYFVDNAGDVVVEAGGAGTDRIYASATFKMGAEVENLELIGVASINAAGNALANVLAGNNGDNWLAGREGNDKLDGGLGIDRLEGGIGDDSYYVDNAGDLVVEKAGEGIDLVHAALTYKLGAEVENLALTGSAALNGAGNALNNRVTGNGGANWLAGREGDDVLDGGAGVDRLEGGVGNDRYIVDNAGDVVVEAADGGADTVEAWISYTLGTNVESLVLAGSAAIDGTGNALSNKIFGNGASNALSGGAGTDAFVFDAALGAGNVDTLADFVVKDDAIHLDRTIFAGIAANGVLAAGAFVLGTAAVDADDRILYDAATGNIWYDADGSGGAAAVQFAKVSAGLALTNADFFAVA